MIVLLFLCFSTGCRPKDFTPVFHNYKYDKQVIEKLPVYDSLVNVLLKYYPSIQEHSNNAPSYQFIPSAFSFDLYEKLPKEGAKKVEQYFFQLGRNFIYGFEVYKDSTIKIYIRDSSIKSHHLHINERLSFYPPGKVIRQREFPAKDTVLNRNWQYWILFDQKKFF